MQRTTTMARDLKGSDGGCKEGRRRGDRADPAGRRRIWATTARASSGAASVLCGRKTGREHIQREGDELGVRAVEELTDGLAALGRA